MSDRQRPRVLVVDDDESMCDLLAAHLALHGFRSSFETDPARVLDSIVSLDIDVVVTDLKMAGMDGLELCQKLVAARPDLPVVLLTAHGTLDAAVAALRVRAFDFLMKPPDIDALVATVRRAIQNHRLEDEVRDLDEIFAGEEPVFEGMVGTSPAMRELTQLLGRVAAVDASVLLTGESGTGKEVAARAVHERSARRESPFVAVNCAAINPSLLESELFGHVKGAFTDARSDRAGLFERARGGTLFLDEIAELPLTLQPKLLRALQERTVRPVGADREVAIDVRLIAATNTDLSLAVEEHRFREDLFYRLNVIEIQMPPLRERGRDVLLLAVHFVERFARKMQRSTSMITGSCAAVLSAYDWPGNVRELGNVIERAVALSASSRITVEDLPEHVRAGRRARGSVSAEGTAGVASLEEIERRHIRRVLEMTRGNKTLAAQILGVNRRTLYRKDLKDPAEPQAVDSKRLSTSPDRA
jgi:two-component system, NtrC family, response regulator AtoC